jgi:Ca2+ transporting ATPase
MVIGLYVGAATVGGAAWWFIYSATGPQVTYDAATHFMQCTPEVFDAEFKGANPEYHGLGCDVFQHETPMTMALSILVTIELLNALNSVSEDQSMLVMPPWQNPYVTPSAVSPIPFHFFLIIFRRVESQT